MGVERMGGGKTMETFLQYMWRMARLTLFFFGGFLIATIFIREFSLSLIVLDVVYYWFGFLIGVSLMFFIRKFYNTLRDKRKNAQTRKTM